MSGIPTWVGWACAWGALGSAGVAAQCELDRFTAADGAAGDQLGVGLAVEGDWAIAGAPQDDGIGSAYVFERVAGAWVERAKLTPSDGAAGDLFGFSVDVDAGTTAVVGAILADAAGADSGAAYVFERQGASWVETQKLTGSGALPGDLFSIGLSLDGDRLAVGACQFVGFTQTGVGKGRAYVFERRGPSWSEVAVLTAGDGADGDRFAVAASLDGGRLLLGAEDDDAARGSAYLFELSGSSWSEVQKLLPAERGPDDQFGVSVSLAGDVAVVGAHQDDDGGDQSGSAYVFEPSAGTWVETAKLVAGDAAADHRFGRSVSVGGATVAVGAAQESGSGSGAAYLFEPDAGSWVETARIAASDGEPGDLFGSRVALSGASLLASAVADDGAGSVYEVLVDGPPAALTVYGCGLNPAGSLTVLGGRPALGETLVLGVDNPLGTQAPGALPVVFVRPGPDPSFPCGTPIPGWGMAGGGAPGELLTNLAAPQVLRFGAPWLGPGTPAPVSLSFPADCSLMGVVGFAQGLLIDVSPGALVVFGLANGARLELGL